MGPMTTYTLLSHFFGDCKGIRHSTSIYLYNTQSIYPSNKSLIKSVGNFSLNLTRETIIIKSLKRNKMRESKKEKKNERVLYVYVRRVL